MTCKTSYVRHLFDQTVLLVAQCFNDISYQRRTNVLNGPMANQTEVKEILKTESEALDNPGNNKLFGPSFNENLAKVSSNQIRVSV